MDVYFDIKNLNSFISSFQTNFERYYECYRMLKKHFNIHVNMRRSQLKENPLIVTWLNTFTQGGRDVDERPIEIDFSNIDEKGGYKKLFLEKEFDTQSAVYLLEQEGFKGNYLFGTVGEELDVLSSLFMEDDQYDKEIKVKDIINTEWDAIRCYTRPCTDIIIVDYYWFYYGSRYQRNGMYERNCYKLLDVLTERLNPMDHVNIIIFTSSMVNGNDFIDTEYIRWNIKSTLEAKHLDCSISFVLFNGNKPEHDRNILSNYTRIEPGSSLSFFQFNGKPNTHGRNFDIKSLARTNYSEGIKDLTDDLQRYINNITEGINDGEINIDSSRPLCNYLQLIKPKKRHFYEGEIFYLKENDKKVYYIKCNELDNFFIIGKCIAGFITEGKVLFSLDYEHNKNWIVNSIVCIDAVK